MRLQADVSCPQAHPSSAVGRRNLSNIATQKYVTAEQKEHGHDRLWNSLAPLTACCQGRVHVLTAPSVIHRSIIEKERKECEDRATKSEGDSVNMFTGHSIKGF